MATQMRLTRLGDRLGIAVEGVDFGRPLDPETRDGLHRAQLDHLVVCVRGQDIAPAQFRDVMRQIGTPLLDQNGPLHPEFQEIKIITSEATSFRPDGKRVVVGDSWHTDGAYMPAPCSLTALYGVAVPTQGGDTQFVNLYDAYDALPAVTKKRIEGAKLIHYIATQRGREFDPVSPATAEKWPRVVHPLVRTHPETGRKLLYICGERMERIVDMPAEESEELLQELLAHATAPRFQYRHQWRQGDIVIWDNRCAMHHANGDYAVGERRYMLRITLAGTVPY